MRGLILRQRARRAGTLAWLVASGFGIAVSGVAAEPAAGGSGGRVAVLDSTSYWRVLHSWAPPLAFSSNAFVEVRARPGRNVCKCDIAFQYLTRYPAEGWTAPGFDDSAWVRRPFFGRYVNGESDQRAGGGMGRAKLRRLSLRGKFRVSEPGKVKGLALTFAYRGGAVAYLNGREIARGHMPAGPVEPGAPADMYDRKVYLREDGKPQAWWPDNAEAKEAFAMRERTLNDVSVPSEALREGENVLAVEIHSAAYPEDHLRAGIAWGACGLISARLTSDSPEGLVPNVVRPAGAQVWNTQLGGHLYDLEYGDPCEPLRPIELAGARNGSYSGRIAVGSDRTIAGLKATAGPLSSPGGKALPAGAVRVSYGRLELSRGSRWGGALPYDKMLFGELPAVRHDDALLDAPPAEVPASAHRLDDAARAAAGLPPFANGAVQTVYVTVDVPKDAEPGDYAGTLTVALDAPAGQPGSAGKPFEVPVRLRVADWTLPDPADYAYFLGLIQSPEGVANFYDVAPFSERHLELMGRSFDWIGRTGGKVLFLTLGAESQYGNEQSLVLLEKRADGTYTHDFRRLEQYVDLALARMGRPRFVVCGVWDSCMHCYAPSDQKRKFPRISVRDAGTGEIRAEDGPVHGTPESRDFWRPVLEGVRDALARRGLDDRMLLGYASDVRPDKATVETFHSILPGVGWQMTTHPPSGGDFLAGETVKVPVRYQANVWGAEDHHDPALCERRYGWRGLTASSCRAWLDRDLFDGSTLSWFRMGAEQSLLADRPGLGQIGADFWPVKNRDGKLTHTMYGRFPGTAEGNLGLYTGQLLHPGPNGPVPTLRYVMMRENIQECEARIFLEKILTRTPCPLPAPVAARCQAVLDERTQRHRLRGVSAESHLFWCFDGWEERSAALYEAAAKAARFLAAGGQGQGV